MKTIKLIGLCLAVIFVNACGNFETKDESQEETSSVATVTLIGNDGKVTYSLNGTKAVSSIEQIINTKKPIMKKLLPIFKKKLIIESNEVKQVWLVEKPNYIKSNVKGDNEIFVIPAEYDLFKTLEELSQAN